MALRATPSRPQASKNLRALTAFFAPSCANCLLTDRPTNPLQQRKVDIGQQELAQKSCPPTGPYSCDQTGAAMLPIIQTVVKTLQVITGTPVRELLRTKPDAYGVYDEVKGR